MSESGMRFIKPPQPNDRIVAAEMDGRLTAETWAWLLASEASEGAEPSGT